MVIKTAFRRTALSKRMALVITALTALTLVVTVLATSTASAAETKTFTGQKNCSTAVTISPPAPGGYCLITQSSLKILLDAKVYYTDATVAAGVLTSPVTLRAIDERGSTATGQCTYYMAAVYPPGHGLCTYSSGTGKLAGFHANLVVGPPISPGVFSLTGMYWFDRDHHDDNGGD